MFEWLFRFLFKYQPLVFQQGTFVLGVSRAMWLVVIAAAGLGAYALFTYRGLATSRRRDRLVFIALRCVVLLVGLWCLIRPTIILKVAVPQQNFVGVLIDDSRSMQIADKNGQPRSQFVTDNFGKPDSPLAAALSAKFVPRYFRFSSTAERMPSTKDLTYSGTGTRLGDALLRARDEMAGLPLSGFVLITDGGDTSEAPLDETIAALKTESIPVFPVGVGADKLLHDIQISRVETPRTVLKGSSLVVDVVVSQTGYPNVKVPLIVENDGRIVSQQEITLPTNGDAETVHVHFTASDKGSRVFKFRIPPQEGEQVTQNNSRESLIEVLDRREKLLYLEGEPRPEGKFILQGVEDDRNLQVVELLRTAMGTGGATTTSLEAQDKFLRLGVDSADELKNGFPTTPEELFAYKGIILGSVEASAFTVDQLRMISDFVSRRGGGLLALGGRRAFAEGGWGGTPVGDTLPVVLPISTAQHFSTYFAPLVVQPTREGVTHPVTQIAATEGDSELRWRKMPTVSTVNPLRAIKPGATTLLSGTDDKGNDQVVLTSQHYGRGKALALTIQDAWMWRMDPSMAETDNTHHAFWQRLTRWLVDGVPSPVEVTTSPDRLEAREPVTVSAWVTDAKYIDVNDGHVVAHVTSPSGKTSDVPMDWTVKRDGEYKATFTPEEDGVYEVKVGAARDTTTLGTTTVHVRTAPSDREYFDAAMRAPLLTRLAESTGGRFYTADNTKTLADAISYSGRGVTVVEERDLWDMPIVLMLLLGCGGAEWAYRRARGLI